MSYWIGGLVLSVVCIMAFWFWCAWLVYDASQPNDDAHADVAIVLGAAAWGEKPSPVFRERINHALALYQTHRVEKLMFTGGTPKAGFATEAEVARKFAIKQGIPENDIIFENQSKDTFQNLVNARQLMRRHRLHTAVLVSDPYHMARAKMMAEDLGMKVTISPTPTSRFSQASKQTQWAFFMQESHALFVYRLLFWANYGLKKIT